MGGSQSKTKPQDRGVPVRDILEPFNFSEQVVKLAERHVNMGYEMNALARELGERRRKEGCTFDGKSPLDEHGTCRESPETRRMYDKYNRLVKQDEEIGETLQKLVREEKADEIAEVAKKKREAGMANRTKQRSLSAASQSRPIDLQSTSLITNPVPIVDCRLSVDPYTSPYPCRLMGSDSLAESDKPIPALFATRGVVSGGKPLAKK